MRIAPQVRIAPVILAFAMAPSMSIAAWTFTNTSSVGADATGVSITGIAGAYAPNGGTLPAGAAGTTIVTAGTLCADSRCGVEPAGSNNNTYGISGFASAATTWTVNSGALNLYSGGLGSTSDGSTQPNHAFDNGPKTTSGSISGIGNTEALMLSFSSSVILSSIGIGYVAGDSDISLFRYTGSSAPTLGGTGATLTAMTDAGWELVGNYANLAVDTTNPYNMVNDCSKSSSVVTCSSTSKGSSWWLISAYNTNYGGSLTQGNDYFKIYAVAGQKCTDNTPGVCGPGNTPPPPVPEPSSFALAALALAGTFRARRLRASS